MANHSPKKDNYVTKKTWSEAMGGDEAARNTKAEEADAKKRAADKGAAARNGGGDK